MGLLAAKWVVMLRALPTNAVALVALASALACASVESGAQAPAESGGGRPGVAKVVAPAPPPKPAAKHTRPKPEIRWLKGQTHVHTDRSHDASTPPERVLEFYASRGYDFISLTDHNRVTVVRPPRGMLLLPGVELTQNSKMCRPKPTPGYRCLIHTTALFVDPEKDPAKGKRIRFPLCRGSARRLPRSDEARSKVGGHKRAQPPAIPLRRECQDRACS